MGSMGLAASPPLPRYLAYEVSPLPPRVPGSEGPQVQGGARPPSPHTHTPPPRPPSKNNIDREGPRRLHTNMAYAHLWGLSGLFC